MMPAKNSYQYTEYTYKFVCVAYRVSPLVYHLFFQRMPSATPPPGSFLPWYEVSYPRLRPWKGVQRPQ